jgi:hypothetical protein
MSKIKGPLIGINARGYPTPVFLDPHTTIREGTGGNTIVITGSSGYGKSFCGFTLCMLSAISGKKTVFLDPKNDARNLITLSNEMDGKIYQWDMSDGNQNGELDPYLSMPIIDGNKNEKDVSRVVNLTDILIGKMTSDQNTKLYSTILDVANKPDPSLSALVMELLRDPDPEIAVLGTKLRKVRDSNPTVSGVIFRRGKGIVKKRELGDGLTIITTNGLKLPSPNTPADSYQSKDRLALGIMYLITDYIINVMSDTKDALYPKTVIIDEAWSILSTEMGKDVAASLTRLGRSHNTACILLTQSVNDISSQGLDNFVATRMAFGAKGDDERKNICRALDIDMGYADSIQALTPGTCFLKDVHNRVSLIHIIPQSRNWSIAFETNPSERAKNLQKSLGEIT